MKKKKYSPKFILSSWTKDKLFFQLIKNSGLLLSGTIIATLIGLVTTLIRVKSLDLLDFGIFVVIIAYVELIGTLTTFVPWQALIKFGAEALERKNKPLLMEYIKISLVLDLLSGISGLIIAVIFSFIFIKWQNIDDKYLLITIVYSFSLLFRIEGTSTGILRLLDNFKIFAFHKILTALSILILSLIVFMIEASLFNYLLAIMISTFVGTIYLIYSSYKTLKKHNIIGYYKNKIKNWKPFLRFTSYTYLTSTITIPTKKLDVILVSFFISIEMAGIYRIFKQIVQILGLLVDPLYQSIYPQLSLMIAKNEYKRSIVYCLKISFLTFVCISVISLLIGLTSPIWLGSIFGESYSKEWLILLIMLIITTISLSVISIHPLFLAMNYVKYNIIISILSNILYLIIAVPFGLFFGIIGIIIAQLIDVFVVTSSKVMVIKSKTDLSGVT